MKSQEVMGLTDIVDGDEIGSTDIEDIEESNRHVDVKCTKRKCS